MKLKLNEKVILTLLSKDSEHQQVAQECWQKYKTEFYVCRKAHGPSYTLKLYKSAYQYLVNVHLGLTPTPIDFHKVDRRNLPKVLWPLRPLIRMGDIQSIRLTMCIARVFQLIRLPINPDFEAITKPGNRLEKSYIVSFTNYCNRWFSQQNLSNLAGLRRTKAHSTMKSGPNGQALVYACHDLEALRQDESLLNSIYRLNSLTGNNWINTMMKANFLDQPVKKECHHSRLSFSAEGGGKTRTFAIVDYWSQFSLRPIHDSLMAILRRLETDGTYDQESAFKRILERSRGHKTWCFDLSGASDRIPVKVQAIMMASLFGEDIADTWVQVMTNRVFHVDPKYGTPVKWEVGQPLGALSSWGAFALWHHIIIEYCAHKEGIKSFREYCVLGDDVVIWNDAVAVRYQRQMKYLGIPINFTKSVTGDHQRSQIEFAKRHARDGVEISGISYTLLEKNKLQHVDELITEVNKRSMLDGKDSCSRILVEHPNSRVQDLLNTIIILRLLRGPFNEGLPCLGVEVDALDQLIKERRTELLMAKVMDLDKYFSRIKPIEELFEKHEVQYKNTALGVTGFVSSENLHPLVWVVNHLGEKLAETLDKVWDEDFDIINDVEYLPTIPNAEFFADSKTAKHEFFTSVVLSCYRELKLKTTLKG